jgi:hypothetical protein
MEVVYFGFLDIQPSPPVPGWFIRLTVPQQSFSISLPCPGALKSREGLVLPPLFDWPLMVSMDGSSGEVPIKPDPDRSIQQITLTIDSVDYTLRLLLAQGTCPLVPVSPPSSFTDVVEMASAPTEQLFAILEPVETLDSRAHALATFMALDRTVLFLSSLAMNETGPGRVKTTNECRDLLYPVSPLAAFVRALCRVYLLNDMIGLLRPILVELCDEAAAAVVLSKSLADQTLVASLSVRLWTAAVEIVTSRLPLPFVIAVEEAFRTNLPEVPTGSFLGAFLTACLVTACTVFAAQDLQISNLSSDSLPLLMRVHTVVVEALIFSTDAPSTVGSTSREFVPLVQGLGFDIRNRATPAFNALVAKCHQVETSGPLAIRFPAIERVSESSILERAACVLRSALSTKTQNAPIASNIPVGDSSPPVNPFLQLLDEFKTRAFELKSKHAIHSFHQYHLHHYSYGTHANPQGPTLADTARPTTTRGA